MKNKKLVFSGVQPTGNLHLGNYLGALKNFVSLQKEMECIYCVVDLHAITVFQDPKHLHDNVLETAASFLASGLDPNKSIIFNQSSVSGHAELAWIINCVSRIGWLNRMTQFKIQASSAWPETEDWLKIMLLFGLRPVAKKLAVVSNTLFCN